MICVAENETRKQIIHWIFGIRTVASSPELNELANVVYAASSTEVSVERNFSALTFIFNRYRCNLTDEHLNDILFIRLNKHIFYELFN